MTTDQQFVDEAMQIFMKKIHCENPEYIELPYVRKLIEYSLEHPKKHDVKELKHELDKIKFEHIYKIG